MRHRSSWPTVLVSTFMTLVFIVGIAVPAALAANDKPPKKTTLPSGQPFKLIQQLINGLDARIDALEAAAPTAGTMWINPLDFLPTFGDPFVAPIVPPAATPGLQLGQVGPITATLQAGVQVPLGFGVTGAIVCYESGIVGNFVNSLALTQNTIVPPFASTVLVNTPFGQPATDADICVQTAALPTPADPSADGPLYLAVGVNLGPGQITIRGIGLQLSPLP